MKPYGQGMLIFEGTAFLSAIVERSFVSLFASVGVLHFV